MKGKEVFEQVLRQVDWIKELIRKRGWNLTQDLVLEGPATEDELKRVEQDLGIKLPEDYKELFRMSKHLEFGYEYDEEMPAEFQHNFSGEISWNLNLLKEQQAYLREWVEMISLVPTYYNPDTAREIKALWADKIPLMEVANGDIIVVGHSPSEVLYFSCQEYGMHGRKLAKNLWEFLSFYASIGFTGGEDSQLEPFLDLSSHSKQVKEERVKRFVKWLNQYEAAKEGELYN